MTDLVEKSEFSTQGFVLTPRTLEKLGDLRSKLPVAFDQAKSLLTDAQYTLFVPFLTKTDLQLVDFEFERNAYLFFPYRINALALLLRAVGPIDLGARYISALSKLANSLTEKAPHWHLDAEAVKRAFNAYLSSAIRVMGVAKSGYVPDQLQLTEMLKAITKVDFGLTALMFVFEETIAAREDVVAQVFELTQRALDSYEKTVSTLLHATSSSSSFRVSGSLNVEGDIDQSIHEFSAAWKAFLEQYQAK